jgi:hypothetical protein
MPDFLQHENIVVSEQGVFEFRSGKQIDGVSRPDISEIRIAYKTAAGRPILQGVIGTILLAIGICSVGLSLLLSPRSSYVGVGFLLAIGSIGWIMVSDALKRRHILFVTARDGRRHKLLFSVAANASDIELFLQKVRQTFGLEIHSDVKDIRT